MIKTDHGNKTERIHALDSLRAIMMLLGLVLHAALTYGTLDYGNAWTMKDDSSTSFVMDYIVSVIHNFRMPIFFVVAGFFGALLFFERSPRRMLWNRTARIFFPFIVFVVLLSPTIIFAFTYSKSVFSGVENPLASSLAIFSNPLLFIPPRTFHLWFLYYLFFISIFSFGLGYLFESMPRFTNWSTQVFNRILNQPILRVGVFSALTVVLLFIMNSTWVTTSTSWVPDWRTFLFYFFFYGFGWILFKSKTHLDTFKKYDWTFTILALVVISTQFFLYSSLGFALTIVFKSVAVWLFVFGITGLFIRYGSQHSHLMRYNSDSSYWIYLLHLSIVATIPGLIAHWHVSALFKFFFVFLLTSLICVITYHYFVRATFIGKFLNGRKYSRNLHPKREPIEVPLEKKATVA